MERLHVLVSNPPLIKVVTPSDRKTQVKCKYGCRDTKYRHGRRCNGAFFLGLLCNHHGSKSRQLLAPGMDGIVWFDRFAHDNILVSSYLSSSYTRLMVIDAILSDTGETFWSSSSQWSARQAGMPLIQYPAPLSYTLSLMASSPYG